MPARAQWTVQDQDGNRLSPNSDGTYSLGGYVTRSAKPGGNYLDLFSLFTQAVLTNEPDVYIPFCCDPDPVDCAPVDPGPNPYFGDPPAYDTAVSCAGTAWNTYYSGYGGGGYFDPADLAGIIAPAQGEAITGSIATQASGTLSAFWQWAGPGDPPKYIDLLLTSTVTAGVNLGTWQSGVTSGLSGHAQATDASGGVGLNDTAQAGTDAGTLYMPVVTKHLVRAGVNGGRAQVYLPGTVSAIATNDVANLTDDGSLAAMVGANASVSGTAQIDGRGREVMIGSDFGQTFYKGNNNQPAPNVRKSDGSMTDDTVVPGTFSNFITGTSIGATYSDIAPSSNWGDNSTYLWQSSLLPVTANGAFNQTTFGVRFGRVQNVPDFGLTYNNPPASDGSSDTIKLTLTDGGDGAIGSNTYTIRFHDQVPKSGWKEDPASPIIHPLPTNGPTGPASNLLGEWNEVGPYTNDGTQNMSMTVTVTGSVQTSTQTTTSIADTNSETTTGSIGAAGLLGASVNANKAFQVNAGVTLGQTYTVTVAQSTTVTTEPGFQSYVFWGHGVNQRFGTCDVYAANGYQGNATWTLMQPQTYGGNSQAILFKILSKPTGSY